MKRAAEQTQEEYFRGVPMVPYDLIKELALALVGVLVLMLVLSALLSSPDVKPVTIQSWASSDPVDFVTTATGELAGTTTSATYGPPYNDQSGSVQSLGFFSPQSWFGVHQAVDPPNDFVLAPLKIHSAGDADLASALGQYQSADDQARSTWLDAYTKALGGAQVDQATGSFTIAQGDYGPLPTMMGALLNLAQAGGLDGLLLSQGGFYQTDYTRPLLFMGDGAYLPGLADEQKLSGEQWGMMNETGSYPGQSWLWLYTLWYQVYPFDGSSPTLVSSVQLPADPGGLASAADLAVVLIMTVLSLALMLIPFIPGLRDIPYLVPVHRLIWRTPPPEPRS
jgi:hypothetical protein